MLTHKDMLEKFGELKLKFISFSNQDFIFSGLIQDYILQGELSLNLMNIAHFKLDWNATVKVSDYKEKLSYLTIYEKTVSGDYAEVFRWKNSVDDIFKLLPKAEGDQRTV
jgi:hypothetical protein